MDRTTETVYLEDIDSSGTTFLLSYGYDLGPLKESITRVGLINYPLVRKQSPGRYQVICGFKRVHALRELGFSPFPCSVVHPALSDEECFLVNLYDNASHRIFNPIEKSMAIQGLQRFFSEERIVKHFLPLLNVNPHKTQLEVFEPLCTLETRIKDAVVLGIIDVHTALQLARMDPESRKPCSNLLIVLQLSVSKQAAFMEYVSEIALRENVSREDVVRSPRIRSIVEDEHLNIPQKGDAIIKYLRERRYPQLTGREKAFTEKLRDLQLPHDIRLTPPPYFEGNRYCLTLHFTSLKQLQKQLGDLESSLDKPSVQSLIEG